MTTMAVHMHADEISPGMDILSADAEWLRVTKAEYVMSEDQEFYAILTLASDMWNGRTEDNAYWPADILVVRCDGEAIT